MIVAEADRRTLLAEVLATDEQEVPRARHMVAESLALWHLPCLIEAAELCVSEMVANSVVHAAHGRIGFTLEYGDDGLRIIVSDGSPVLPATRQPSAAAEHGRGMLLIDHFAKEWGTSVNRDGTKSTWVLLAVEEACQ